MVNKRNLYKFEPDYAVPPGDTLLEVLESKGMSQTELALRTGRTLKTINEIIQGKAPITAETALQLERVLGVPASLWNNLERNYRADLAAIEERKRLEANAEWVKQFPIRALARMGCIKDVKDPAGLAIELLSFFGVASPKAWEDTCLLQARIPKAPRAYVCAWLRLGEISAEHMECAPYDRTRFRSALASARTLTVSPPDVIQSALPKVCADAGVAVVFVPELPKTRVSGATRWLSTSKALIQLSLRYESDDELWSCFFHEAGHILLHGKKDVFIEEECDGGRKEEQANRFAADFLIPASSYRGFVQSAQFSETAIRRFAESIGIAPGIVVGRLQRDALLPPSRYDNLRQRCDLKEQEAVAV